MLNVQEFRTEHLAEDDYFSDIAQTMLFNGGTISQLEQLVSSYASVCRRKLEKGKSANSVKRKIRAHLVAFDSVYKRLNAGTDDSAGYFNKISDLLAHYIQLEFSTLEAAAEKTSHKGRRSSNEIMLYLSCFLANREDRILDTIMKIPPPPEDNVSSKFIHLYTAIITAVMTKAGKRLNNDLTYIRFMLLVKLHKELSKNSPDLQKQVLGLFFARVKPPVGFSERCSSYNVLPTFHEEHCDITELYLKREFDIRRTVVEFLDRMEAAGAELESYPNLMGEPPLLYPKVVDHNGPLQAENDYAQLLLHPPKEEFSEDEDELFLGMRCNEPNDLYDEMSVYELVAQMKQPCRPRISSVGMVSVLKQFPSSSRGERRTRKMKKKPFRKPSPKLDDDEGVFETLPSATVPIATVSHFTGC